LGDETAEKEKADTNRDQQYIGVEAKCARDVFARQYNTGHDDTEDYRQTNEDHNWYDNVEVLGNLFQNVCPCHFGVH
jgi:hypothetical protein